MRDDPKIPRIEKCDIDNNNGINDCDSFDSFIEYFQNLKEKYERENPESIRHMIEIEIEYDNAYSGWAYLNIINVRLENDEEYRVRCNQRKVWDETDLKREKQDLKRLMNKHPKEVLNWMMEKPEK